MSSQLSKLRTELAKWQKPRKGYILQFQEANGEIREVKITSGTFHRMNKKDVADGLGEGLYYNVMDIESKEKYSVNLGASGDLNFKWISYKASENPAPSLRGILDEHDPDDE